MIVTPVTLRSGLISLFLAKLVTSKVKGSTGSTTVYRRMQRSEVRKEGAGWGLEATCNKVTVSDMHTSQHPALPPIQSPFKFMQVSLLRCIPPFYSRLKSQIGVVVFRTVEWVCVLFCRKLYHFAILSCLFQVVRNWCPSSLTGTDDTYLLPDSPSLSSYQT